MEDYPKTLSEFEGRFSSEESHGINKWGDRKDIQDEGTGSEQGGDKDREDD